MGTVVHDHDVTDHERAQQLVIGERYILAAHRGRLMGSTGRRVRVARRTPLARSQRCVAKVKEYWRLAGDLIGWTRATRCEDSNRGRS